jgi:general secretion pathway protein A
MYLEMFGFAEKPFHITPNPRFIFLSKNHKEAFAHLLYGIQQRVGFLSLSGEVGTGKTTVLRTLLEQLEESEYRVALIFNPCLTAMELLQTIHREFTIDFDPEQDNLVELHDSLNRFLLQQREVGITVVLVVDEAQNLDPKVLEQLRLLSNLETETEKLIQMVLVGQPELDEILERRDLRQLRQRLAVRYQLKPMNEEDTARYVAHRVKVAGCREKSLFAPAALAQIYRYTRGTPRLINLLCDRALLVAYSHDSHLVTKQDISSAHKELPQAPAQRNSSLRPAYLGLLVVLIISAMAILLLTSPGFMAKQGREEPQNIKNPQRPVVAEPAVDKNIVAVEQVSSVRIAELRQKVAALTVAESGSVSVQTIAKTWNQAVPATLPTINGRASLKSVLGRIGFDRVEIQGTVADLLKLDAPIILEIILPNVTGKRFLTVSRHRNGQLLTAPALTESGWLDIAELKEIWFGKAWLPYKNYQQIPLIDRPNAAGEKIADLQQLLSSLDGVIPVSGGVYDKETIDTVTRFQQQQQLAPDGRVGSHTLYWLYRETGQDMPRLTAGDGS